MHAKLAGKGQVCVGFFGDGAANNGSFHESLNLAAIQQLPVIFVCENNLYATATAVREATLTKDFADRAAGYGMPGRAIDGNDVLEVYAAASEAVARARAGEGPTLLESKTYRKFGHYVGEDSSGYRSQEEVDAWMKRDPIKLFKEHLLQEKIMSEASIEQMEKEVVAQIEEAKDFAVKSPFPEPEEAFKHVLAD